MSYLLFIAGLWSQHFLYLTKELCHWYRHCRPHPDDRRGGRHHDPRVQEEKEEFVHDWLIYLQRSLHQHRLQPQQHEQEELRRRSSTSQRFLQEKLVLRPISSISSVTLGHENSTTARWEPLPLHFSSCDTSDQFYLLSAYQCNHLQLQERTCRSVSSPA